MPAIDINAWMQELLGQLNHSRQRQIVSLQGPRAWCDAEFHRLSKAALPMRVLSNRELHAQAIPFDKAATCLGDETRLLVLDLFGGFNPDVLCIAAGLVTAGGVLLILSPPVADWDLQNDRYASWQDQSRSRQARFVDYFFRQLNADASVAQRLTPQAVAPPQTALPVLLPTLIEQGETAQQSECLKRIEAWVASARPGVVLLRAERGRGKSSCLGLLVNRLQADYELLVCASSRQAVSALLQRAPAAAFIAPDQLLHSLPPADLVIIDEAAMIPQSLLRQIRRAYPRLVMATTSGGYEGTGQGFLLRFVADLDAAQLLQIELDAPVRWCRGDYLEGWLNRVLLLDSNDVLDEPESIAAQDCELEVFEDPGSLDDFALLQQVYQLLNAAHYRTRPSDLRMLMENPDLVLIIARCGRRVVGATLLNREGGFEASLSEQIFLGNRRPRGHLLAQMLTAQAGLEGFAEHRGLRVQRIAVHPAWRRRGLGSGMLTLARDFAVDSGLDYLGASFALDPRVVGFWQQAGFNLVHISFGTGKSSGNHSIAVLIALRAQLEVDIERLADRMAGQLPTWMTQFLQDLEAEQVVALLRYASFDADLGAIELREIEAFASANRGFELCFVSLQRFVMQRVAAAVRTADPLLIEKAIQNRPWDRLPRAAASDGRKQLLRRLRRLVEAELKAC